MDLYTAEHDMALRTLMLGESIEQDFATNPPGIVVVLLHKAKEASAHAMLALSNVDPLSTEAIRALQNDIKRFRDIATWIREIVDEAQDIARSINVEDIRGLADLVNPEYQED